MDNESDKKRLSDKVNSQLEEILQDNPLPNSFTQEQLTILESKGFSQTIPLKGKTLEQLKAEREQKGQRAYLQDEVPLGLVGVKSLNLDVVFNPNGIVIPNSQNLPYEEQVLRFLEYNRRLKSEVEGVRLLLPTPADLAEITFNYFDLTGKSLWPLFDFVITNTPGIIVGNYFEEKGLNITQKDEPSAFVGVPLLIIPDKS